MATCTWPTPRTIGCRRWLRTANPWGSGAPSGVAADGRGTVFVADTGNHRIVLLSSAGEVVPGWGGCGGEVGRFHRPSGVAVDPDGNLYVADTGNSRVQKLTVTGDPLSQW